MNETPRPSQAAEPDALRERMRAVVQKWSGHLSERMLDDLVRAAAPPRPSEAPQQAWPSAKALVEVHDGRHPGCDCIHFGDLAALAAPEPSRG